MPETGYAIVWLLMIYRRLGRTGLMVSEVGFGGLPIGGLRWGDADDESSIAALQRAFDLGVNFFDTADVYGHGHSEEVIGLALGPVRDRVLIATKAGIDFYGGEPARANFDPGYLRSAVERSLARLRTTYVDVLLLHDPPQKLPKDAAVWDLLATFQREGLVRFFGVSARTANDARAYLSAADGDPPSRRFGDVIQVAYNLLDQEAARKDVFVEAHRQDWGVVSRVPLASGMLGGRYHAGHYFPPEDFRSTWPRERLEATIARVDALRFLSRPGRTLAQTAIAFCLSQVAVSTVISGARNPEQAEENVAASASAPLPPEDLRAAYELSKH